MLSHSLDSKFLFARFISFFADTDALIYAGWLLSLYLENNLCFLLTARTAFVVIHSTLLKISTQSRDSSGIDLFYVQSEKNSYDVARVNHRYSIVISRWKTYVLSSREVNCRRECQRFDAILVIESGILVVESELSTCNLNWLLSSVIVERKLDSIFLCFMFCMFYMCSSAKVIYCYLRAAVSVVSHLAVLLRIL